MNQVQVHILQAQVFQRVLECSLNMVRVVVALGQLCGNEDFLPRNPTFLDGFPYRFLSSVLICMCEKLISGFYGLGLTNIGRVDMAVARLQRLLGGFIH